MDKALFRRFCELAHEKAGISLNDGKEELVAARVGKRQRALGIDTFHDYLDYLENSDNDEELVQFLDVISTNFTSFFREPDHLEDLGNALRGWAAAGQKEFRLWSAASSSGEEPYSMAIVAADALESRANFRILATDISTRMLAECERATYPESRVHPVPAQFRGRYFERIGRRGSGEEASYLLSQAVRSHVVFRRLNLSTPPFPMRGPLDVVFCRNVMIYFDQPVRQALISEIGRLLKPGGLLYIGHTETLTGVRSAFRMVRPSVFRLPEAEERAA